jgi:hypothetical protein
MIENEMAPPDLIRQACTEMSAYLAAMLTRASYDPLIIIQAGEAISGWSLSTSEHAEHLLSYELDLTGPKSSHRRTLAKSTNTFSAHFASGKYDHCFANILESYIDFVSWRGDVPTTRSFFKAPKNQLKILNLLADLGYLNVLEQGFCWTDKVGHAMLCAGAWTPDFQSYEEIQEYEREKRAREIADSLSSDLLVLAQTNPEAAFWPVYNSLNGENWYQEEADKLLVERVIEIAYSRARQSKTALN